MKIAQGVSDQGHRSRQNGRLAPPSYAGGMSGPSEQSLRATPFVYRPPETLPRREWLYGRQYIRRFVSGTVASGGMGKSALVLVEAIAMVTGRDLLGHRPRGKFRVWYINGEDPGMRSTAGSVASFFAMALLGRRSRAACSWIQGETATSPSSSPTGMAFRFARTFAKRSRLKSRPTASMSWSSIR
jgi:AAA domain